MSQADTVLRMLRDAGARGVHTFELRQAYIGNPSQRVRELEDAGHRIITGPRERLHGSAYGVRYRLASAAPSETAGTAASGDRNPLALDESPDAATGHLFDIADARSAPRSPYDDDLEAA